MPEPEAKRSLTDNKARNVLFQVTRQPFLSPSQLGVALPSAEGVRNLAENNIVFGLVAMRVPSGPRGKWERALAGLPRMLMFNPKGTPPFYTPSHQFVYLSKLTSSLIATLRLPQGS